MVGLTPRLAVFGQTVDNADICFLERETLTVFVPTASTAAGKLTPLPAIAHTSQPLQKSYTHMVSRVWNHQLTSLPGYSNSPYRLLGPQVNSFILQATKKLNKKSSESGKVSK